MDPKIDPFPGWQGIVEHPLGALSEAFGALLSRGFLDVSALWRQFYADTATDYLRWYSLLIYAAGCGVAYLVLARRGQEKASPRHMLAYLLPREIWSSRSFRIDIQFHIATLLRLPQLLRFGGILLVAAAVTRLGALHLDHLPGLATISAALARLPLEWRLLVQFLLAFIAFDFGFYWGHRLLHRSKILWQFHRVHHYSRQLNMLAGIRHHPVDPLVTDTLGYLAAALVLCLFFDDGGRPGEPSTGAPYWLAFAVTALDLILSRFTHSHVTFSLGRRLDRILVTPAVHAVHHSRDIPDVNFGNSLSLWDALFGTFHAKDATVPVRLGIAEFDDGHYRNFVHAVVEPFRDAFVLLIGAVPIRTPPAGSTATPPSSARRRSS